MQVKNLGPGPGPCSGAGARGRRVGRGQAGGAVDRMKPIRSVLVSPAEMPAKPKLCDRNPQSVSRSHTLPVDDMSEIMGQNS